MKHARTGAILAALMLAGTLAGCGGGGGKPLAGATGNEIPQSPAGVVVHDGQSTQSPVDQQTVSAADAAIIKRYIQLVATSKPDPRQAFAALQQCSPQGGAACLIAPSNAGLAALGLQVALNAAANNPQAQDYIGPPPEKIKALVSDTLASVAKYLDEVRAFNGPRCDFSDPDCADLFYDVQFAGSGVSSELDLWESYADS